MWNKLKIINFKIIRKALKQKKYFKKIKTKTKLNYP